MSLAEFFENTASVVAGVRPLSDFVRGGSARIEFYTWLVSHDLSYAIERRYPHVKRAFDALEPSLWSTVMVRFIETHPPTHWDITRFGDALPRFLQTLSASESRFSAAAEIAEFQALLQSVGAAPDDSSELLMDRTLFIRSFEHRIPQFCADGSLRTPESGETAVLIYRSHHSRAPSWVLPSRPLLLALGHHLGLGESSFVPDPNETVNLQRLGILPQ